jgi:hypothetical protein
MTSALEPVLLLALAAPVGVIGWGGRQSKSSGRSSGRSREAGARSKSGGRSGGVGAQCRSRSGGKSSGQRSRTRGRRQEQRKGTDAGGLLCWSACPGTWRPDGTDARVLSLSLKAS